jgi:hypothetical protein
MRGQLPIALLMALQAAVSSAAELQGFSFDYQISGDRSIAPFQVFDDGMSMFLQFRDPAKIPTIFVRDARGSRVATPEPQGSYMRIAGIASRLELVSERKTAAIVSTRKALPAPTAPAWAQVVLPPGQVSAPPVTTPPVGQAEQIEIRAQLESLRRTVDGLAKHLHMTSAAPSSVPSGNGASAAVAKVQPTTSDVLVFEVEPGQRLSEAVRRFVANHKLQLDWDTGGADFEVRYGFRVVGGSIEEVLFGALSPFKLTAVAHRGNGVVAVSRAG